MSIRSVLMAASALLATANAHITMDSPVPYSLDKLDSSPITAEQYPCKSQNGFTVTTMNNMKVGETQKVSFKGSAVHGGGSCQLSYTQDTTPTKNSVFKVIKSIEGGCPGLDSKTNTYEFTLPDSIPNGKGTFAWTWFSKLSGAPELYMNCAPIDVTGGASDASKLSSLPDMLVANIASTTCRSPLNHALKFPDPGSVLQNGNTGDVEDPTGDCGATNNSTTGGTTPASSGAAQPSSAPSSTAAAGGGSTTAAASSAAPTNTGGVFAPSASSAITSTKTTLATVTAAPSTSAGTGSGSTPTGIPSSGGSTCSTNGAILCNGANQFGICNNGNVVWQAVAAGTTCSNGSIQKRGYHGRIARPRAVVPGKEFTPDN